MGTVNGDEGERENGDTHGSYGEGDRGESLSDGGVTEFNRRDDTAISGSMGEKTSRIKCSRRRFDRRK